MLDPVFSKMEINSMATIQDNSDLLVANVSITCRHVKYDIV
jgi:hypothetical protein